MNQSTYRPMDKPEATEKKNLLVELAKRKAENASAGRFGILGRDLATRFGASPTVKSYSKRGGRNGSGKP